MRISDWSSDVCSSDLKALSERMLAAELDDHLESEAESGGRNRRNGTSQKTMLTGSSKVTLDIPRDRFGTFDPKLDRKSNTSELQSLMRISYAVFCLKKKININTPPLVHITT